MGEFWVGGRGTEICAALIVIIFPDSDHSSRDVNRGIGRQLTIKGRGLYEAQIVAALRSSSCWL